jgi:hypothetical protein
MRALGRAAVSAATRARWPTPSTGRAAHVTEAMDVAAAARLLDRARAVQAQHPRGRSRGRRRRGAARDRRRDLGAVPRARPSCRRRASIRASDDRRRRLREPAARAASPIRSSCSRSRPARPSPRSSARASGCCRSWRRALDGARRYPTPFGARERTPELVRAAIAELRDPVRRLAHEWWARGWPHPRRVRPLTTVGAAWFRRDSGSGPSAVRGEPRLPRTAQRVGGARGLSRASLHAARRLLVWTALWGDGAAEHRRVGGRVRRGARWALPRRS